MEENSATPSSTISTAAPRRFKSIMVLGKGTNNMVSSATDELSNVEYAVKLVYKIYVSSKFASLVREIRILNAMRHTNIVGLLDVDSSGDFLCMFTELCYGNLDEYVHKQQISCIPYDHCFSIFIQIVQGLSFLHHSRIIHGDLQPSNILILNRIVSKDDIMIKICDFGRSIYYEDDIKYPQMNLRNITPPKSYKYASPESLLLSECAAKTRGHQVITPSHDVWSAACTFIEVIQRSIMFTGKAIPRIQNLLLCMQLVFYLILCVHVFVHVIFLCIGRIGVTLEALVSEYGHLVELSEPLPPYPHSHPTKKDDAMDMRRQEEWGDGVYMTLQRAEAHLWQCGCFSGTPDASTSSTVDSKSGVGGQMREAGEENAVDMAVRNSVF